MVTTKDCRCRGIIPNDRVRESVSIWTVYLVGRAASAQGASGEGFNNFGCFSAQVFAAAYEIVRAEHSRQKGRTSGRACFWGIAPQALQAHGRTLAGLPSRWSASAAASGSKGMPSRRRALDLPCSATQTTPGGHRFSTSHNQGAACGKEPPSPLEIVHIPPPPEIVHIPPQQVAFKFKRGQVC